MHKRQYTPKSKTGVQQRKKTTPHHNKQRRKTTAVNVIGFDIGGANTKAAFITTKNGTVQNLKTKSEYFPVWKNPEKLKHTLTRLTKKTCNSNRIDLVAITMTAELADAYRTKREGVNHILTQVEETFPSNQILILDIEAKLRTLEEARAEPLKVASANWAATGWMVSQIREHCVIIDVGSTTTSIIPIVEKAIMAEGKTDLEKIVNGELVYTGSLRTNVAATVGTIPTSKGVAQVSSEIFAQSADVHLILGNITEKEYTVETADGKEKSRDAASARLARVVCADTEMLTEKEIVGIAKYVYERQVEQIAEALRRVCNRINKNGAKKTVAVVTGIGRNFLARKAAIRAGFVEVIDFAELANGDIARASTAFAVALMGASILERRIVRWMQ